MQHLLANFISLAEDRRAGSQNKTQGRMYSLTVLAGSTWSLSLNGDNFSGDIGKERQYVPPGAQLLDAAYRLQSTNTGPAVQYTYYLENLG